MLITEEQIRKIIRKNLINSNKKLNTRKTFKRLIENITAGNAGVAHDFFQSFKENDFINDLFANEKIDLSKEYKDNANNLLNVIDLTYSGNNKIEKIDITAVWNKFAQKIETKLDLDYSIAKKISDIFMKHDSTGGNKIFDIFKEFPMQKYTCNNSKNIEALAEHIVSKSGDDLYQELYAYHESSSTFNTGKGEYLCVLLTKDGKSGGTQALDVMVGNSFQYDLKQITAKSSSLKFTLSAKSGIRKDKNHFIETYQKIGQKAYALKDEFKKLGIDQNIIDAIDMFEGQVGSSFKKDAAYAKIVKNPAVGADLSSLAFGDINDAFIQAIKSLRRRTYVNVTEIQNDIKTKFNQSGIKSDSFDTSYLNISAKINQQGQGKNKIPAQSAIFSYTPLNKKRNIDEETFNKLNDIYDLDLKTFKDYDDAEAQQLYKSIIIQPVAGVFFWKIDVDEYNKQLDNNIMEENVGKYFKLNNDYSPMIFPRATAYFAPNKETIIDNIKTEPGLQAKLNVLKSIPNTHITGSGDFSYADAIKPALKDIFNMQVVLTVDQMKKINKIVEDIQKYGDVKSVNATSKIGDEYLIVEPLKQDPNEGEFVIDVSFYKNKKKRHIDTLHSADFEIKTQSNKIRKTGKDAEITQTKDIERKLDITLTDVISDKDEINKKLKEFNLFNTLQPAALEKIFKNTNNIAGSPGKNIEIKKIQKDGSEYSDIEADEKFDFDSASNKEFITQLRDLKEKTNEDNIINMLYDLYVSCDEIEKNIKSYYAGKNEVMVMKDNDDKYSNAYSWTEQILNHEKYTDKKGFILGMAEDGILCQADKDKYDNQKTIKEDIFVLLNEIYKLSLELQSLSRA